MHITVKGIPYNDFALTQDALWSMGTSTPVTLIIEHNNVAESNAVAVYIGVKKVGYVRTSQRRTVCQRIEMAQNHMLPGHISGMDKDTSTMYVWVNCDSATDEPFEPQLPACSPFANYSYKGSMLHDSEQLQHLYVAVPQLLEKVQKGTPWNEEMTSLMDYVLEYIWLDISAEGLHRMDHLLKQLRDFASGEDAGKYLKAADKLEQAIDDLGSPRIRNKQLEWLQAQADSERIGIIMKLVKARIEDIIAGIPEDFLVEFSENPSIAIGSLRYQRLPYEKLKGIYTALALYMRYEHFRFPISGTSVPTAGQTIPEKDTPVPDVPVSSAGNVKELCVQLNSSHRRILDAAEKEGIIVYNAERQGYDAGQLSSHALVAYLCGKLFCGDYTKNNTWKGGGRFDAASYCTQLFGFDVSATRRKTRSKGASRPPCGYEKIDTLFEK